jgi:5-methylcytosine-specific restriction endonuclease McrA
MRVFDSSSPRCARPEVRAHPVELLSTRIVRWLVKPGAISVIQVDLRDPGRSCWYCGGGEGQFETEHRVPVSRGGKWRGNVVWACADCNHLNGSLTAEEFR